MPSYVVTGASRGLGLEFARQLSANPANQIFALVRNTRTATNLAALPRTNLHVLQADILDPPALKAAAAEVSRRTGGTLDVLINNAAFVEPDRAHLSLTAFDGSEAVLEKDLRDSFDTNVIGVIHTTNVFLPLLRAGPTKKVITLSTGIADPAALHTAGLYTAAPYCISKAATNMVVTKYAIQFKDEGFVFLALSPGFVNTLEGPPTPDQVAMYNALMEMFRRSKPDFERALTPQESVEAQLRVIDAATVKDTGAFISHHGNTDWL